MSTESPLPAASVTPSATPSVAPPAPPAAPDRPDGASRHWLRLLVQRQAMARCNDLLDEWRLLRAMRRAGLGRQRRSWRQIASAAAGLMLMLGGLVRGLDVTWPVQAATISFSMVHTIDGNFDGAAGLTHADIDGDGDLDVLGAAAFADDITWWENDGSPGDGGWTTHTIITNFDGPYDEVVAADLDGDADLDVLSAAGNADDVTWWENDGTPADGGWTTHTIDGNFDGAHSISAADLDGDGDLDVLGAAQVGDDVTWWESDGTPADGGWITHTIDGAFDSAYGISAADLDGDGDLDVLGAAQLGDDVTWWESDGTPANGGWTTHTISGFIDAPLSVAAADLDGDGDLDVLVGTFNFLAGTITWWENDGAPADGGWTTHTIISFEGAINVAATDLDSDGDLDILGAAQGANDIAWWENDGTPADGGWTTHTIDGAFDGALGVAAADLDGDGDLDVLGAARQADDITWWENRTIHRNALLGGTIPFTHTIDDAFGGSQFVAYADLDGDGDLDVLGAGNFADDITWWENDGTPANGGWTTHTISGAFNGAYSAAAADLDGDGDLDVLGAAFNANDITWWENDGTPANGGWTTHTISGNFDLAISVTVADLDGDGDLDVLGAALLDDLKWWENDGTPANGGWTTHTIDGTVSVMRTIATADLDRDGDFDVLGADSSSNDITWWENDGTPANGGWTTHTIVTDFDGARSVTAADLDGDGDLDVLGAARFANDITWWENDDTPANGGWTTHTIDGGFGAPYGIGQADLDMDGDVDVLGAAFVGDDITWWENDGTAADGGWMTHTVNTNFDGAHSVAAADLDRDGDLDVLGAAYGDSDITWWQNKGGQFTLPTAGTAPPSMSPGGSDDFLKIGFTHNGRTGDNDEELVTLQLRFEKTAPITSTLTTAEANAIIQDLKIYRDDGSGVYEAGTDTLVNTVGTLALNGSGDQIVTFTDADANVQLPFATGPRTYFVVLDLTTTYPTDPARNGVTQIRVTHITEAGSTAQDRSNDLPLGIAYTANTQSSAGGTVLVIPPPTATPTSTSTSTPTPTSTSTPTATPTATSTSTPTPPPPGVSKSDSPDPVRAGTDLTYSIAFNNSTGGAALNVHLSDPLPANETFKSLTAPAGWTCSTPTVGSAGTVSCDNSSVPTGVSAFTLVVSVNASAPAGYRLANTVTFSGSNFPTVNATTQTTVYRSR